MVLVFWFLWDLIDVNQSNLSPCQADSFLLRRFPRVEREPVRVVQRVLVRAGEVVLKLADVRLARLLVLQGLGGEK